MSGTFYGIEKKGKTVQLQLRSQPSLGLTGWLKTNTLRKLSLNYTFLEISQSTYRLTQSYLYLLAGLEIKTNSFGTVGSKWGH